MKSTWRVYQNVMTVLPQGARRYLVGYAITLGFLAILDALAIGLLALVVGPLSSGKDLVLPIIGTVSQTTLIGIIGVICFLILFKGVCAVLALWVATRRFAKYELAIGSRLFESYLSLPWVERLQKNSADIVRLTDGSVAITISGFLLPGATILGEVFSFTVVVVILAIAKPLVAAITVLYLGAIGAVLSLYITKRAKEAGRVNIKYTGLTQRLVTEMVGALKEITLRNKSLEVAEVVRDNRRHSARARSNMQFLAQVPRYVLESALVGGFVLVGIVGYSTGGPGGAVAGIALFGLAGFRMAPSIIRLQAVVAQISSNIPHAEAVYQEIRRSEQAAQIASRPSKLLPEHPRELMFEDVSFKYVAGVEHAVRDINITIPFGASVAFVGASGSGKSTMIDLILGLIEPTEGSIRIDNTGLSSVTSDWRGRVGYVPQDVALFDASIAQNVALTWSKDFDRDRVREALRKAQLLDFIEGRPGGIDGGVGERGLSLSGGQRQRLGIARALYSDPLVLVMDEATSALDSATESAITRAIGELKGRMTVVTVAHRLATIQDSDLIFFMSRGSVEHAGKFAELVRDSLEFRRQAQLAGLVEE